MSKFKEIQCLLNLTESLRTNVTSERKGNIAIRRIFSLVAHNYKDRIFKLVQIFRNLHGSVGKYTCINFSISVTAQQFVALNPLKFAFSAPTPLFQAFTQVTISIKFQGNAAVFFKGINAKM